MAESEPITLLLHEAENGKPGAMARLMEEVYSDLQRRAARCLAPGSLVQTLEPAALVNEAYLKLIRQPRHFEDRGHFFAVATRIMMQVLIDHHRARVAAKRGGGALRVTLQDEAMPGHADVDAHALSEALQRLEELDRRKAEVVKLRAIWGLEMKEIAETLRVSLATVERDWRFARSWLAEELDAHT